MDIRVTHQWHHVAVGQPFSFGLTVAFRVPPTPEEGRSGPLNVALVIDRSESMAGRLAHALTCAGAIVARLRRSDHGALILVDDRATVAFASVGRDRAAAHGALREVRLGRGTNLSAGWLRSASVLREHRTPDSRNRILLLTDGQPTRGVTDADALLRYAAALAADGITTSAVVYGGPGTEATPPEALLARLVEVGGGTLGRVAWPAVEAGVPWAAVAGLALAPVAVQNTRLLLTPSDLVREVHAPVGVPMRRQADTYEVAVPDLLEEDRETVDFWLDGRPIPDPGPAYLARLQIEYDSVRGLFAHHEEVREFDVVAMPWGLMPGGEDEDAEGTGPDTRVP